MPFSYTPSYASTRLPVFARNLCSTSHPLAAQAGLRMLQQGVNTVDAAVGAAPAPVRCGAAPRAPATPRAGAATARP